MKEALQKNQSKDKCKCLITNAMSVIGGKWKPVILYRLYNGINRFGMLQRSINGISKSMLTKQLREMESHKILNRKIFAEMPPRVEYTLTKKGESLIPVFKNLLDWAKIYQNN